MDRYPPLSPASAGSYADGDHAGRSGRRQWGVKGNQSSRRGREGNGFVIQEFSDLRDCRFKTSDTPTFFLHLPPPPIFLQTRFIYLLLVWGVSEER